ncbi:MAG: hypothetical protein R3C56_39040 [Pirellulaceae bacterium]
MLPWPSGSPVNAMRSVVGNGLRPINNTVAPSYAAPLQTASSASAQVARDPMQQRYDNHPAPARYNSVADRSAIVTRSVSKDVRLDCKWVA